MSTSHIRAGEGRHHPMTDGDHIAKVAVRDAGGAFEVIAPAKPMGPPHVSPWTGALFLPEGRITAVVGETSYDVDPGGVVVFPAGTSATVGVIGALTDAAPPSKDRSTESDASPRRTVQTMRSAAAAGTLVAALLATPALAAAPPPRPLYLALGDSVAVGVGAQPPATEGYVPELHELLAAEVPCGNGQALGCRLDLLNISLPGATTTTLLTHQLPRASSLIRQRRATAAPIDDVRLITLDIGGSDIFGPTIQTCSNDPQAPACATTISTVLGVVATNYGTILSGLREAAGPDATIAVMSYYNPLPACVLAAQTSLADLVLEGGRGVPAGLNDIIRVQAAAHDAVVAETGPIIDVHDLVGGRDCLHPDTSGHDDIAAAFDVVINPSEVIRPDSGARGP
ncbi:MAG TPA: GDSL-type esterase/lipase family protein [Microlunatus sp.]